MCRVEQLIGWDSLRSEESSIRCSGRSYRDYLSASAEIRTRTPLTPIPQLLQIRRRSRRRALLPRPAAHAASRPIAPSRHRTARRRPPPPRRRTARSRHVAVPDTSSSVAALQGRARRRRGGVDPAPAVRPPAPGVVAVDDPGDLIVGQISRSTRSVSVPTSGVDEEVLAAVSRRAGELRSHPAPTDPTLLHATNHRHTGICVE